jgi:NADPH:quinone reductase-like Zn-dependent oxidoreductase
MKAIVCTRYGPPDVLQLKELEKPVPGDDEVLVRVHAATVMAGDCQLRSLDLPPSWRVLARVAFGFRAPRRKVLGQELAGVVESVGKDVRRFKTGDQVFASTGLRLGAYAEYACLPENGYMAIKPASMSFEEAAAVPSSGLFILPLLRGRVRNGQRVLVIGAAGSMGTMAVQLAKAFGAEVTGVDSTKKLDMLRSIGADRVVDYTKEDYLAGGETYDVILDAAGKSSFRGCMRCLREDGVYLLGNPSLAARLRAGRASRAGGKKVIIGSGAYRREDLAYLSGLIEEGKIRTVIDRRYPLEQTAEAHRYVDTGQKAGNVVITIG